MWRWFVRLGAIGLTILGILLGEGYIIALVLFLGFFWGFVVLIIISVIISWAIVYIYGLAERPKRGLAWRIQNWIQKKEKELSPIGIKLAKTSKVLGLIISSVTVGPFITTVFIKTLGYSQKQSYVLALISSVTFSLVWSAIYSGAITGIKILLWRLL